MGRLFQKATERSSLKSAWHRIRTNGQTSAAAETRVAIEMFGRDLDRNIHKIQRRLRSNEFEFDPQQGVLKTKASGGKRGIVMASVQNRIVERAWLDCLQSESSFVRKVINQPTSVGGVPHRSVPHGLKLINDAMLDKKVHFIRSDISGFFDNVSRRIVLNKLSEDIDDELFLRTLDRATTTTLANEEGLGENRKVFPTDDHGVAQGSPLSPLFGNILLHEFDLKFNDRGIVCIRFIDDFVILGEDRKKTTKAFESARAFLSDLGLRCHDPFEEKANEEKTSFGKVDDGFVFLGYDIRPGLFQPSRVARQKLIEKVGNHIALGRISITDVKKSANSFGGRQRYAQTLTLIDKVLRGWGEAFSYSNAPNTLDDLDFAINRMLDDFRAWFSKQIRDQDWKTKRRLGGVCLLTDVAQNGFDDLPFQLERQASSRSKNTITISTDGSILSLGRRRGKDQGPGGWSYVVHETNDQKAGRVPSSTNNRMELQAVIEAVRSRTEKSIVIRTDSQYVSDIAERGDTVRSNSDLWKEFEELRQSRNIRVVWVKGHAGDPHNERADTLAQQQAKLAKDELLRSQNKTIDNIPSR
jgi:ribonuclease HI/retron-type reverse transcriptase